MRSPGYVGNVVKAYRTVLDAPPGDRAARGAARHFLDSAMGRKATRGYFPGSSPTDVLAPQHSGNIGIFLGKVKPGKGQIAILKVNAPLVAGDRLRLHQEKTGERHAFSLKQIRVDGKVVERAAKGAMVALDLPVAARDGDTLYKVDSAANRGKPTGRKISPERFAAKLAKLVTEELVGKIMAAIPGEIRLGSGSDSFAARPRGNKGARKESRVQPAALPLWFRSDDPFILSQRFPLLPERLVINLSGEAFNRFLRMKKSGPLFRRVVWALPFIIDEDKLPFFQERIARLVELGFREWQVGHFSQTALFAGLGCEVYGDYTLNVLNSLTGRVLAEQDVRAGLMSIENDRENLGKICRVGSGLRRGMVVYGFPALFTSRYSGAPMQYDQVFKSPKGEGFVLRQAWGYTRALPVQPFSLLTELADLAKLGIDYGVIDLSGQPLTRRVVEEVFRQLTGPEKEARVSGFNFYHTLS
jgi:putative protease